MSTYIWVTFAAVILTVVACSDYGSKIEALQHRIDLLREECNTLSDNAKALDELVGALQRGAQLTSFAPITESGRVTGYRVTFKDSGEITLYNQTTDVSIAESGGRYYWMAGGAWMTDAQGNKIEVAASSPVPEFQVIDGEIKYSFDGTSWHTLGRVQKPLIESVSEDDAQVLIVLSGGATIAIPKPQALSISLTGDDVTIGAGEAVPVGFLVSGCENADIQVVCGDGWEATVSWDNAFGGTIVVSAPDPVTDAKTVVLCGDGKGRMVAVEMRLKVAGGGDTPGGDTPGGDTPEPDKLIVPYKSVLEVGAEGGVVEMQVYTNTTYSVAVNAAWVTQIESKALSTDVLRFSVEPNTSHQRSATVYLRSGNLAASFVIQQEKGYRPPENLPTLVSYIMPCCRTYNRGTTFLVDGQWHPSHNYGIISHVRDILQKIQDAGINTICIDFSNASQWDDYGESAQHNGDGGEFWQLFRPMLENIVQVCQEKEMKYFFLIGNITTAGGISYWNGIARRIWENWAQDANYQHYGYGDDRPLLVCFLPGTTYASQIRGATAANKEYLLKFRVGTCQINSPITPTFTDGWGYRNYSQSSDGKVRFACPNGGVPPQDWYRVDDEEWRRRVKWVLQATEYAIIGSYDDTCDAIHWGMADSRHSITPYHVNEATVEDPYIYYNIVRKAILGIE